MSADLTSNLLAFLLTLLVFSYLVRDNPLYRFALHLFVGVAASYAATVVMGTVLIPRLVGAVSGALPAVLTGDFGQILPGLLPFVPLLLGALIGLKLFPRLAPFGNVALAFMVGVGAAVAVAGGISGTLLPQVRASWGGGPNLINTAIMIAGTVCVLMYFFYTGRALPGGRGERPPWLRPIAAAGQGFVILTLAALYVGALAASFALLTERLSFLVTFMTPGQR